MICNIYVNTFEGCSHKTLITLLSNNLQALFNFDYGKALEYLQTLKHRPRLGPGYEIDSQQ